MRRCGKRRQRSCHVSSRTLLRSRPLRWRTSRLASPERLSVTALVLDGKALAAELAEELQQRTSAIVARSGTPPRLAIIRFDESGPSDMYVRSLVRAAERTGIDPLTVQVGPGANEDVVREQIHE